MQTILALDQGTTSSRAILFDRAGTAVASAQREFRQIFPRPGWVEHDAWEIWESQLAVARACLRQARARHGAVEVAALGITNQRETVVLWDRASGEPVANAIVWQDRRTAAACDVLAAAGHGALIQRRTGLVIDAYFSGTKLAWLLDEVPGARQRAERGELAFGTVDSWLVWNLTAGAGRAPVHATDASNASRTMLYDIHAGDWSDELLALLRIPRAVLPQVVPSSGVVGTAEPSLLGAALPIAGIAGDQQAATFGQACFAPGMAKNTYGTGCFMLLNTGTTAVPSRNRLLTTVGWQGPRESGAATAYCLEGGVFMAGATVQWLRDGLQIIRSAPEVEALAASVPDSGDVHLVPAFAGLGAPDWDSHARAVLIGMTRGTTRAHIARAALESIAWQVADVFAAMERDAGLPLAELRVDGGASTNDLLMQLQADVLGVPVVRPKVTETTALGAAYLAGLAVGFWSGGDEIAALWAADRRFAPALDAAARQARHARWRQAVDRARKWAL
ncbi:glycerol kinase GlpK [Xylophilus sp.]|uniref:glycerol kinase GlpK n=1 Tax=Xylophilus sp. TaxID=2653893 RepID=UPI0013BAC4AC|nr:glycerol kinase GlpK [Xylophilus sp.]KAF1046628.1 MAG: Glycerol kinase [Xylophilus sp.]